MKMKRRQDCSSCSRRFLFSRLTRQAIGSETPGYPFRNDQITSLPRKVGFGTAQKRTTLGASPLNVGRVKESSPLETSFKQKLKEWQQRQYRIIGSKLHRSSVKARSSNRFSPLSEDDTSCKKTARLWKQALVSTLHLGEELGVEPVRDLPLEIQCGALRSAVLGCFPDGVCLRTRLSIKTVQKLEEGCCSSCEPRFLERLETWREARFQPIEVDPQHLERFKKAFKINVAAGWNRMSKGIPYFPNGNASLHHTRKKGGNWNREEFSDECRFDLVFSSGKPRIVTMYSSYNSSILYPLHACMQRYIEKRKWCLVGPPTPERIKELSGKDYLSFDYESATDNIKQPYVEAAVEALIERADPPLSTEEVKCMRVLSALKLEGFDGQATRGQPMGSLLSFPLLSLCNKTLVDLALADRLQEGQLSFKEWTSHPLLVNGDDLLTTEPRPLSAGDEGLAARVIYHGDKIGLTTNKEKTLASPDLAEINSTLFRSGKEERKVNVASLYMKPEVEDVLGFARESTLTPGGFRRVVRANCQQLARQAYKGYSHLPPTLQVVCRQDRKIKKALMSVPAVRQTEATNLFPICPRPEGYDLTSEEEVQHIRERVNLVRQRAIEIATDKPARQRRVPAIPSGRSWRSVRCEKRPDACEDSILSILSHAWYNKRKRMLAEEGSGYCLTAGRLPPGDLPNCASRIVDAARAFRNAKITRANIQRSVHCDALGSWLGGGVQPLYLNDEDTDTIDPFVSGVDWISLG